MSCAVEAEALLLSQFPFRCRRWDAFISAESEPRDDHRLEMHEQQKSGCDECLDRVGAALDWGVEPNCSGSVRVAYVSGRSSP